MVIREKEVIPPHRPLWRDDPRRRSHGHGHGRLQGVSISHGYARDMS